MAKTKTKPLGKKRSLIGLTVAFSVICVIYVMPVFLVALK